MLVREPFKIGDWEGLWLNGTVRGGDVLLHDVPQDTRVERFLKRSTSRAQRRMLAMEFPLASPDLIEESCNFTHASMLCGADGLLEMGQGGAAAVPVSRLEPGGYAVCRPFGAGEIDGLAAMSTFLRWVGKKPYPVLELLMYELDSLGMPKWFGRMFRSRRANTCGPAIALAWMRSGFLLDGGTGRLEERSEQWYPGRMAFDVIAGGEWSLVKGLQLSKG